MTATDSPNRPVYAHEVSTALDVLKMINNTLVNLPIIAKTVSAMNVHPELIKMMPENGIVKLVSKVIKNEYFLNF